MLHVILLILKIIGIVLAAILGIVLLVLLLLLFVPVRYRAFLSKRESFQAEAKVSWLLHLISVPVSFRDGELSVKIKVLGITIKDLMADEEEVTREVKDFVEDTDEAVPKAVDVIERPEEPKAPEADQSSDKPEMTEPKIVSEAESPEKPGIFTRILGKVKDFLEKLKSFLSKILHLKYTIRRFCVKIKKTLKKIQRTKNFVLDERTKSAVRLCLKQVLELLRKLLPKKVRGELHFGMEDPALTGEILGGISIFYPVFMDNVKVIPDFEESCLEGELFIKGRLRLASVLRIAWRLFWDKNIRFVYRKLNL